MNSKLVTRIILIGTAQPIIQIRHACHISICNENSNSDRVQNLNNPRVSYLKQSKKINKADIKIIQDDLKAYNALVDSIVENRRLAWEIVVRWINKNGKLLPDDMRRETKQIKPA